MVFWKRANVSAYIHIITPLPRPASNFDSNECQKSKYARALTTMKSIECHRINRAFVFIFIQSVCPMMVIADSVICDRNYSYGRQNILKSCRLPTFRINQTYKSIMFPSRELWWHEIIHLSVVLSSFIIDVVVCNVSNHSPWNETQKLFPLSSAFASTAILLSETHTRMHIPLCAIYLSGEYKVYSLSCIWNLCRNCLPFLACHNNSVFTKKNIHSIFRRYRPNQLAVTG